MNFEFNKMAGAVLGTAVGVMAIGIIADIIYQPHRPAQPGYVIAVVEGGDGNGGAAGPVEVPPIADRLQVASLDTGLSESRKCIACHTFEEGGPAKVGPNLWDIVGAHYAHAPGFNYSPVIREKAAEGDTWTYDDLDHFLENPRQYLPGTLMAFAGIRNPQQRADLIAWLREQSDDPEPLPAATAPAPAEPADEAPAEEAAPATAPTDGTEVAPTDTAPDATEAPAATEEPPSTEVVPPGEEPAAQQ